MSEFIQWVESNFNTLFSGLGVYVISLIIAAIVAVIGFVRRKKSTSVYKVTQKNIIAGGDVVGRDKG
ncbi:hypothetical protein [Candidatus Sororendozoicomonas aggregata]|uniref:hypothetical protein n=1 Tax=Candidatus Sororendozoicomonas aggregata TaxID=3073239 RepID=UPI002ED6251C